jgi:hypothetical protein
MESFVLTVTDQPAAAGRCRLVSGPCQSSRSISMCRRPRCFANLRASVDLPPPALPMMAIRDMRVL